MDFYKTAILSFCVICKKPATYQIKRMGETYTRACDKHADQEVERLQKSSVSQ